MMISTPMDEFSNTLLAFALGALVMAMGFAFHLAQRITRLEGKVDNLLEIEKRHSSR